jgi:2-oxoglutarate dehydrogenase E2 component (dihydrolipoamide succinyltransferase)
LFAAPIINRPQVAILGVGAIQKRVIVVTDVVGNDEMAKCATLALDHP